MFGVPEEQRLPFRHRPEILGRHAAVDRHLTQVEKRQLGTVRQEGLGLGFDQRGEDRPPPVLAEKGPFPRMTEVPCFFQAEPGIEALARAGGPPQHHRVADHTPSVRAEGSEARSAR